MTEHEINTLLAEPEIFKSVLKLKEEFIEKEAKFLKIKDNDFLSLVFMTPSIALAKADEHISISEGMDLNKKARKLSQGKYFFETDPVIKAMEYLLSDFNFWEDKFYTLIQLVLNKYCHSYFTGRKEERIIMTENYATHLVMSAPYLLIRFLGSVFLNEDDEVFEKHQLTKPEFNKLQAIAERINIRHLPVYEAFISKIEVKG